MGSRLAFNGNFWEINWWENDWETAGKSHKKSTGHVGKFWEMIGHGK